ncbi:protoporphyrinogen oxidase [bacterium]|nr:protoporphyrinogen oxidase [bacterium]
MGRRVVIVGGGISGLATAWYLLSSSLADTDIVLFESESHVGGTARTESHQGYLLETGPNGFLDNRTAALDLCHQLGLENDLVRAAPAAKHRYIFLGDKLRRIPAGPWEFLKSDLLSFRGKLRVLAERFVSPSTCDTDESIYSFGCRRIGKEATEILLDAFVTGILAGDTKLISLPASFPRMREMEREFGGLFRAMSALAKQRRQSRSKGKTSTGVGSPAGTLTTVRGGMGKLMQRLAERLGTRVHLASPVTSLDRGADGTWHVTAGGQPAISADAVVLSCPASAQAKLLAPIESTLSAELASIAYAPAAVVVVGYSAGDVGKIADGFGYLSPHRLGRPVLGVIFSSSIFPEQAPAGAVAFRAILGGWGRPDVLNWDDAELVEAVRADLRTTLAIDAAPQLTWVCRWPTAIPQYHLGHLARVSRIDEACSRLPGLYLTGNALRGVALYECVADADRTARRVIDHWRSS